YGSNPHGMIYGNASDFYDMVASDYGQAAGPNHQAVVPRAGGGPGEYYEDVYDEEYFDEDDFFEDDDFEDESEEEDVGSCDADDECGDEASLEDSDEDEEDEECDFDESSDKDDDLVDGHQLSRHQRPSRPHEHPHQQVHHPETNDLELYSAQGDFCEFVRG